MDPRDALRKIADEVDYWVDERLPNNYPNIPLSSVKDDKVIRDAVGGYQVLKPYEYLLIDSPILQRLRYTHQTALAYMIYPTANHTRFDHSLGVAKVASDFAQQQGLSKTQIAELRLAGFLHDVGQCFFSHLSESLMEYKFKDLYEAAKNAPEFAGKDLHFSEILSYLIIKSHRFNKMLEDMVGHYSNSINIDIIANLVIGKAPDDLAFLSDIISGPFDADKCDYLIRDCYFCGIRADIDVPRVIISAALLDRKRFRKSRYPRKNLVMRRAGVPNLEQIVFNKMLLFPAIYHHHKIRALECMVRAVFEKIWDNPDAINRREFRFDSVYSFLCTSEQNFLTKIASENLVQGIIQGIVDRQLLKRCLVLSDSCMTGSGKHTINKMSTEKHLDQIRLYRELIWDLIPHDKRTSLSDLWLDLPPVPPIAKDADQCFIDENTSPLHTLSEYFPYPRWVESYQERKWRGHVFYVADDSFRLAANKAAQSTFKEMDIHFNKTATSECKLK
jgi:HD superfamily phosphohydrolase